MRNVPKFDAVTRLIELTGPRPRVVVAFSGGVDSTVLAHALGQQRRKLGSLRLVHVDHGLQAPSGEWARHCARVARGLRLPFVTLRVKVARPRGASPEAAAREARYAALAGAMQTDEVLVTAQHRDDQVETLLLQLFRGAGVAGLAAMPGIARFGPGRIARPLLAETREDIEKYARRHRLPVIREQWQGAEASIARSARHMADAASLLAELGNADLAWVADGDGVSVAGLRALPESRRRNTLRAWIARYGLESPSTAQMMEIVGGLLAARQDAQPEIRWRGAVMRRRGGRLILEVISEDRLEGLSDLAAKSWPWKREAQCVLNRAGDTLSLVADRNGPIDLELLPELLEIRARAGGERLRPGLRARMQALKKLIQAAKLDVEARARLPLLFSGDRLIAAGDRWIDASIAANDKSRHRARLRWTLAR
jgi:tRNA(Ile)-lysidine synthase